MPHATQPGFADLSGAIAAAQLIAPTTGAFGGIYAITCPAHQWVDVVPASGTQPTCAQPASGDISGLESRQILSTLVNFSQVAGATDYYPFGGMLSSALSSEGSANAYTPIAGTFRKLVCASGGAPGTGNSITCTLRVNNASPGSGPTCTISNSATSCTDSTDTATIAASQAFDLQVVFSASAASQNVRAGIEFDNP